MIMRFRYFLTLILVVIPMICFSQTENRDSISIRQQFSDSIPYDTVIEPDGLLKSPIDFSPTYSRGAGLIYPYRQVISPNLQISDLYFVPGQSSLFHWDSGEIIATGGVTKFPGMMQIENGDLGVYQYMGNFTFHAGGMANKYGYFNGLHTQYGLNGSISYQFTPRISATLFGEYYFGRPPMMANGMPMPMSMMGYYGRSTYGVSFDYQINDHWGVETGVQTVQQVGTNRYRAEPIVTPYYKINKKVAIGLPVGQILYHIFRK